MFKMFKWFSTKEEPKKERKQPIQIGPLEKRLIEKGILEKDEYLEMFWCHEDSEAGMPIIICKKEES